MRYAFLGLIGGALLGTGANQLALYWSQSYGGLFGEYFWRSMIVGLRLPVLVSAIVGAVTGWIYAGVTENF